MASARPGMPPLVGAAVLTGIGRIPGDPATRPLAVLLAEQQPGNRMLGADMLREAGHTCHIAADWKAAMAILTQVPLDALLLDLDCPGAKGLDTVREIRGWPPPLGLIAVLAVTGRSMPGQQKACREADADALVIRPYHAETLEGLLREAVVNRTPPESLDATRRAELREELGAETLRELDNAAMLQAGQMLRSLRESAGLPAVRAGALVLAEALEGIAAVAAARAARDLAETPGRRPELLPLLFNRLMSTRQALRRG